MGATIPGAGGTGLLSVTTSIRASMSALAAVTVLLAGAIATASPSQAASATVRRACTSDVKRLCPKHKFDTPELRYCMEAKSRQISSRCVRALEDDGTIPRGSLRR